MTDITYVYAVEINNKCYVHNIQPWAKEMNNTVHYARQYSLIMIQYASTNS